MEIIIYNVFVVLCIKQALAPCSTPPYLLAGQHGATSPASSPGGGFLNFIQILHLAVCTLPYIHVYYPGYATAWLSPLITCFAPPEHATWLRAWLLCSRILSQKKYTDPFVQLRESVHYMGSFTRKGT